LGREFCAYGRGAHERFAKKIQKKQSEYAQENAQENCPFLIQKHDKLKKAGF